MQRADSLEKTLMVEKLRARGEGGNWGWDGWMASLTQWTWIWANSGREWRTGKPGVLQSMGSQKFGHNCVTEQQQQTYNFPLKREWRFLGGSGGRVCLKCGSPEFDPWVGKILWRRKWQATPVFLPGKSHGWKNLAGYIVHGVTKSRTQLGDFNLI